MRKSKLTEDEIYQAEKSKDDRKRSRAKGFSKMEERDSGRALVRNFNGPDVIMEWPTNAPREEGVAYRVIPEGKFLLLIGSQVIAFDAEEFRRNLRWV